MFDWLKPRIVKVIEKVVEYKIVEIEKPRPLPELTEESRKAIVTLSAHPGFQYLLAKFRLQRHFLESQLKGTRHTDLAQVQLLQAGIFWCGWLEEQVNKETLHTKRVQVDPADKELEAFKEILASLEKVE